VTIHGRIHPAGTAFAGWVMLNLRASSLAAARLRRSFAHSAGAHIHFCKTQSILASLRAGFSPLFLLPAVFLRRARAASIPWFIKSLRSNRFFCFLIIAFAAF